jgi:hypothetical protein
MEGGEVLVEPEGRGKGGNDLFVQGIKGLHILDAGEIPAGTAPLECDVPRANR